MIINVILLVGLCDAIDEIVAISFVCFRIVEILEFNTIMKFCFKNQHLYEHMMTNLMKLIAFNFDESSVPQVYSVYAPNSCYGPNVTRMVSLSVPHETTCLFKFFHERLIDIIVNGAHYRIIIVCIAASKPHKSKNNSKVNK